MMPGDSIPWHFHKGDSYVVLARGTLTERHVVGPNRCAAQRVRAGSAFVEGPGEVHMVTNTGPDVAVIWWSTRYPKSDGVVDYSPDFRTGGVYFVAAPSCND